LQSKIGRKRGGAHSRAIGRRSKLIKLLLIERARYLGYFKVAARDRGIGKLAEQLIVEHPDWTYRRIADEVNSKIDGAEASEKSVRWYASRIRKHGATTPARQGKRI
jgi:hypothetical protein